MKKILWLGVGVLLVVTTIYALRVPKEEVLNIQILTAHLDAERQKALAEPLPYELEGLVVDMSTNVFTEKELEILRTEGEVQSISKEKAIEDVETLFKVLKYGYGGYVYFGGDEVFLPAKEAIIAEIDTLSEADISPEKLQALIANGLSFVIDTHFSLNNQQTNFKEQYSYYGECTNIFQKDAKGYYQLDNYRKWYVEAALEGYLKQTIDEEGRLVYGLFTVVDEEAAEKLPQNINLKHGFQSKIEPIKWQKCEVGSPVLDEDKVNYTYQEVEGIPVVSLREMVYSAEVNQFINDGEKLQDAPVIILDLRNNTGGTPTVNYMWLYNVLGELVYPKQKEFVYNSQVMHYLSKWGDNRGLVQYELTFNYDSTKPKHILKTEENDMGWIVDCAQDAKWHENDTLLFVLINKKDYSSAETFIRQLQTVSHVILVGTNTNGCLITGNPCWYAPVYLPNSKLPLVYGNSVIIGEDKAADDARGILPDIYIASEDALDAVVRCYKYYEAAEIYKNKQRDTSAYTMHR